MDPFVRRVFEAKSLIDKTTLFRSCPVHAAGNIVVRAQSVRTCINLSPSSFFGTEHFSHFSQENLTWKHRYDGLKSSIGLRIEAALSPNILSIRSVGRRTFCCVWVFLPKIIKLVTWESTSKIVEFGVWKMLLRSDVITTNQ